MSKYIIPHLPLSYDLETKAILKQVNKSNQKLAELKGVARTIPTPARAEPIPNKSIPGEAASAATPNAATARATAPSPTASTCDRVLRPSAHPGNAPANIEMPTEARD
jgi:hypothetical protein